MTIEDKSVSQRVTLNSTDEVLSTQTVPAGQCWYVGQLTLSADGTGDDGIDVYVGVAGTTALDNIGNSLIFNAARGANVSVNTSLTAADTNAINAYATGGDEIRVYESGDAGTTGGYGLFLEIRRLI